MKQKNKKRISWEKIADSIPRHDKNDCKNHWNSLKLTFNAKNVPFTEEEVIICLMSVWFVLLLMTNACLCLSA